MFDFVASTVHLAVDEDGDLYQSVPIGEEESDWKRIGRIDDDYCVDNAHHKELTFLQSEWADFSRRAGEMRFTVESAYHVAKGF